MDMKLSIEMCIRDRYILFKTGMRISEFTGLTLSDLDFENRTINIDHQLQKTGTLAVSYTHLQ